jgi:hypothetical protein
MMQPEPRLTGEQVLFENVSWRDYRQGPSKRAQDVPWVAYRLSLTHEEIERIGDEDLMNAQATEDEGEEDADTDRDVWEIWCRTSKTVYFITDDGAKVLKIAEDPLGLTGFFPQAAPVQPIGGTGRTMPVCPYEVYRALADELDDHTKRIRKITEGLKVVGFIVGGAEDLASIEDADDNTMIPLRDMEGTAAIGGLKNAIVWWPIEQAITVLRELYAAREQVKQAIYEITGISDIIRGQGAASETATAQNIKTQWGSLRIKKMQRLIERQVRDIFVITAEIIALHFSPETLQKMAGFQIPPEAAQLLERPLDHYRIDVESDSTVRADATTQRQEMGEFLNASAQFFSTMAPIAQSAPASAGPMIEIYASFARKYNLGKSAEDAIEEMVKAAREMAKNPPPNPEQEAKKAEMQMAQQQAQHDMQLGMKKMELEVAKLTADVEVRKADLALRQQELQLREAEGQFNAIKATAELQMEDEQRRAVKIGEDA